MATLQRFEPVIGLEVHCQLKTASKLFCGCSTGFGALPNHQTCPVCLGMPGVLPVLNRQAVDYAIKLALALGATIRETSVFARKQYFYPDLPKGYQITQYDLPYCEGGGIRLASGQTVALTRIHLEEDAGKNVHASDASYVDVNRAGIPLVEIVSRPEIRSPSDAADYLRRLHSLVRHLDICDGNMEEGSFRCDANVSIRPRGATTLGTRCEIKNLNSFRNIERAISYEILRQADLLEEGQVIRQQTLLFDPASGRTQPMRSKEDSHDYRYLPDPDLKPLRLTPSRIASIRVTLPELPEAVAARYVADHGLTPYDSALITSDRDLARYYEDVVGQLPSGVAPKVAANWILSDLLRVLNEREVTPSASPVSSAKLASLLKLIGDGTISGKIAKAVFDEMVESGDDPHTIIANKGLNQISDEKAILALVKKVLAANPAQVDQYRSGRDKVFGFFVGQIMRESAGKMNPGLVNKLLKECLDRGES